MRYTREKSQTWKLESAKSEEENDVKSIIYSPYVPCDLWGRIMRTSL